MKNLMVFICSVMMLTGMIPVQITVLGAENPEERLEVICSPDLFEVMQECAVSYHLKTGIKVNLTQIQHLNQITDRMDESKGLALLTKDHIKIVDPIESRVYVLGREVYVPVMNMNNPYLGKIREQGISQKEFARMYSTEQGVSWGEMLALDSKNKIQAYRTADPTFTSYLTDFTEVGEQEIGGMVLSDCEQVVESVTKDPYGVGFCKLSQLKDLQQDEDKSSLIMVPVDLNDNDRIDHFEKIYGSVDELYRGIWIGKYTGALYSRVFAVIPGEIPGEMEKSFLQWLIVDGQEILASKGYSSLLESEQANLLAALDQKPVETASSEDEVKVHLGLLLATIIVGLGLIIFLVLLVFNDKRTTYAAFAGANKGTFSEDLSEVPGGYYFDRSHTWTFQEKDGSIRIGLDSFIQKLTGAISKVEMKDRGEHIRKGEAIFTLVQNGKRMDIKSPVSGKILANNEKLKLKSNLINQSPYSDGWVYMIEPDNWTGESSAFFRAPKYAEWIRSEVVRLRDFLAGFQKKLAGNVLVLQEGGEISEGILQELGPEVWEDFQSDFLKIK